MSVTPQLMPSSHPYAIPFWGDGRKTPFSEVALMLHIRRAHRLMLGTLRSRDAGHGLITRTALVWSLVAVACVGLALGAEKPPLLIPGSRFQPERSVVLNSKQ